MKRALADYRVLLLDQRGTGRSTPVGSHVPGDTPEAQAAYLAQFRADALVRAGPELRWLRGDDVSIDRARGAARGDDHRRAVADRAAGRRRLPHDVRPARREEPRVLRALSGRPRPRARHHAPARRRG